MKYKKNRKHVVSLSPEEKRKLKSLTARGNNKRRVIMHALILLDSDRNNESYIPDSLIARTLGVSISTIYRTRKKYAEGGLHSALYDKETNHDHRRVVDGRLEANIISIICSTPPEGRSRWTLELIGNRLVELKCVDSIANSTLHLALKKMKLNPGELKSGA